MKFQGFVGGAYKLDSVNVDCQRCVNLFPEVIESGSGKEAQVAYLKSTPGLRKLFEVGEGPIRLIQMDQPFVSADNPPNRFFVISGNKFFTVSYVDDDWVTDEIGTLSTSTGPVSGVSLLGDAQNLGIGVFVDGVNSYHYWKYKDGVSDFELFRTFALSGFPQVPNATHVALIDGYLIYNEGGTGRFYVSDWQSLTVNPLSFATSEGSLDYVIGLIANNRLLWMYNEKSVEIYSNTGNASFPFERISGGFIEKGIIAGFSLNKIDGILFWLGRDASGQGVVYAAQGLTPQRISTHAIEAAISKYADISTATSYTYQQDGHAFYVLNFAEATWVYDLSTKLWHERAFTLEGELVRHRSESHDFMSELNLQLVGDFENGNVYALDQEYYSDDGSSITRMRVTPHVSAGLKRLFCKRLDIDMEVGVGLDGEVQGSDPQVMLDWSNDGGHTWSSEVFASIGKKIGGIGQFKTRVFWNRLGSFRDRVFRMKITDPVKVVILGAEIDIESGVS